MADSRPETETEAEAEATETTPEATGAAPDEAQRPQDAEAAAPDTRETPEGELAETPPDEGGQAQAEEPAADVEAPEAIEEPASESAPRASRGGVFPLLLGGALAGGIGFAAAFFLLPGGGADDEIVAALAAQDQRLTALTGNLEKITTTLAAQDPGAEIAAALARTESALAGRFDALEGDLGGVAGRLDAIDARLTAVEKRPIAEAADTTGAIAAYERELERMREELAAQRQQNEEMSASVSAVADQAKAEIAAASTRAQELETRAAMMRVMAALESGGSFASALPQIGADVPAALSAVADSGVATLTELQRSFPEAARAGLSAALRETTGKAPTARLENFLRSQLGVRSLSPREGDDPDAVLSRAEAALGEGRLADALAELQALPESGRAAMAGWTDTAQARLDAVAAAKALAASLNVN
ncbi:hypothetical protein [Actibacterium sp. MT2.3-13A]|uniref:COG4223 family protein n=1 Tax=Actibacterium sp. MT2.3-13A TaxID=2828332 RepID=UPI001BACAC7F|nr:hypothetical protein [Actibacterium sp. MT2.3-13A]